MKSMVVHLVESGALTLLRGSGVCLHKGDQLLDDLSGVLADVHRGTDSLSLGSEALLNAFVHLVALEVDVLELDKTNTRLVLILVEFLQVSEEPV